MTIEDAGIIELLTSCPTPERVLAIRPSPQLQARASELLARSKAGNITIQEETELERILNLEHLVRIAKARAYQQK
jgi:hypothetical protein